MLVALGVRGFWVAGRTTAGTPPQATVPDRVKAPPPRGDSVPPSVPPARTAAVGRGTVRLRATPPTALIFIDGRQVGEGVLLDYGVRAGTRYLRVTAPGYRTVERAIVVKPGASLWLGQITLQPRQGGGEP